MKKGFIRKTIAMGMVLLMTAGMSLEAADASSSEKSSEASSASSDKSSGSSSNSLREAQEEKEALERALALAQQTIRDLKASQGDIQSKVAELNRQLLEISARITELENQLTEKSEDILATQVELEAARQREMQQYADMRVRIQFMYENRQTSYLDALLSAQDISDFLNAAEYISQIQSYDREKLAEYAQTVQDITDMEAQLEQEYADLQVLKAAVEENKATVAAMMRQKESELADIAGDIADAQSEAAFYEAEIQAQEELIAAIKRAEAEKAAAGVVDAYEGGAFLWPCPSSRRVTSDYGSRSSPMAGASSNHKGIDIGAAYGADIIAAADGTVKAATHSSSAGNYVMIDHGGGLYTVYMHASSLLVSEGQKVTAGQVIAKVGSTGISTGNHLHFGVSLNGSYVSPWSYLGG